LGGFYYLLARQRTTTKSRARSRTARECRANKARVTSLRRVVNISKLPVKSRDQDRIKQDEYLQSNARARTEERTNGRAVGCKKKARVELGEKKVRMLSGEGVSTFAGTASTGATHAEATQLESVNLSKIQYNLVYVLRGNSDVSDGT
jgi:hypothetical protein